MSERVRASGPAAVIGIVAGVCLGARAVPATEATDCEVAQPTFDEGGCVQMRHVTYLLWVGSRFPGREIDLTCAFGRIP